MTQIEVSFSAFLTIFVHFWPILAQYFYLYSTKIMFWAFFGTQVTPLAILHTPKSCLVALNGLKRAKNWLKLIFHFFSFFTIYINFWPNLAQYFDFNCLIIFHFGNFLVPVQHALPKMLHGSHSNSLELPRIFIKFWEN